MHQTGIAGLDKVLGEKLPKRFAEAWSGIMGFDKKMNQYTEKKLEQISHRLSDWRIKPVSSEGFGKAEVTVGGVSTEELSSKTMGSKRVPGLYFIGEVVDVTGWLGGYNFQWAWASGWVAGQYC